MRLLVKLFAGVINISIWFFGAYWAARIWFDWMTTTTIYPLRAYIVLALGLFVMVGAVGSVLLLKQTLRGKARCNWQPLCSLLGVMLIIISGFILGD